MERVVMQFLRLSLMLLFGIHSIVAQDVKSVGITCKEDSYTRNQDITAFKAALYSLGIDSDMRTFDRMFSEYKGGEDKWSFLQGLIMSEGGIKQFQKKYRRKPVNSDIESAYQALLDFYEKLPKKNASTSGDRAVIELSNSKAPYNAASQLLYAAGKTFSSSSDGLNHVHHHNHSHKDELSSAHKCSHNHGSHRGAHHCHHNHHHDHSCSHGHDVVHHCRGCSHC